MGLIDFLPMFRVEVDGKNISKSLAPRMSRLTVTDGAGVQSDQVTMTLSDTGLFERLQEPRQGAEIKVWLGYPMQLQFMGLFIVDGFEIQGPPDQVIISGSASINGETTSGKTALTDQKKRSWPAGTPIGDLVKKVAVEHGLQSSVSQSLLKVALPHIDQIDESDINMLSRIAREHDAIAKPGNGRLIMAKRGESLTASGQPMPELKINLGQVSSWNYRNSLRAKSGAVIASYQDLGKGKQQECKAGEGEPVKRLKRRYPNKAAALQAAASELSRIRRAGRSLSINMKGNPDAKAEARLIPRHFRSYVDEAWLITRAVHTLDSSGYRTSISAEPVE
ncbi:phage late control D family protein [Pseudophaeobacter flagellatus]|uniref:phage late control D family protein n=1 Tax=Pseudophaeobacter flagellatus TaxID=2899119 RepID=UPI001E2D5061|nr:contractile injection system protein, VgrG/Pvc8 family [Pseudophaeobacter flagellatus]MCD9147830.1 late control protein D [Pseudophaeobacter flagellatus]